MPGARQKHRFVVELQPLGEALADPRKGSAVMGWLAELTASDHGPARECVLCCAALTNLPACVLAVETLGQSERMMVAAVCAPCSQQAGLTGRVATAVERELGLPADNWRQAAAPGLA